MNMKFCITKILICCFFFLCASCAANINRQGYVIDDSKKIKNKCDNIIIVKDLTYETKLVDVLGKISASDTGFSTQCSESYVLNIFSQDACIIGADVLNITKESPPNIWGTCYDAEAEFLKIKDREMLANIKSHPQYTAEKIKLRSESSYTECMKSAPASAFAGGLVGALIHYSICKSIENNENQNADQESAKNNDPTAR